MSLRRTTAILAALALGAGAGAAVGGCGGDDDDDDGTTAATTTQREARPYLGLGLTDVSAANRRRLKLPSRGLVATTVFVNGPADKAGLERLDVVLEINGTRMESAKDPPEVFRALEIGGTAEVVYLRRGRGERRTATLEVTDRPEIPRTPE